MFQEIHNFSSENEGICATLLGYDDNYVCDCTKHCEISEAKKCEIRNECNYYSSDVKKTFCASVLLEICNFSDSDYYFSPDDTHIVTSDGYDYCAINFCQYFYIPRVNYGYVCIAPMTRIKACAIFPQLAPGAFITRVYNKNKYGHKYLFDFKIKELDSTFVAKSIETQKKQNETSIKRKNVETRDAYEKKISELEHLIFQRLNNVLTKSQKNNLENLIMNLNDRIERNVSLEIGNDELKENLIYKLNKVFSDYKNELIARGESSFSVFERNSKEGVRADLGDITFRSSWEANIARILNKNNISWEYEKNYIQISDLTYLPDFTLDSEKIIEVKGFWDNSSITKCDAYIRRFGIENILIVDADLYVELEGMYSQCEVIENWEKESQSLPKQSVSIVGMRFAKDPTITSRLSIGQNLIIEKEPNNQYDPYAILVKTQNNEAVGHIEKSMAAIYTQKLNLGMTFDVVITSIDKKVIKADFRRNNWDKCCIPSILLCKNKN